MSDPRPIDIHHSTATKNAVLITNLGTPEAPTAKALRPYLRQFLSDPRVIEVPRLIWQVILNGVILVIRPRRSAHAYAQIWTDEGSPLAVGTRALATAMDQQIPEADVFWAMRYGQPCIEKTLTELTERGYRRIMVLPLYPQYSATTTASTFDALAASFRSMRWLPHLRFETAYHDQPEYLQAVADSIADYWKTNGQPDKLLFSFHGIPQSYFDKGDPYFCQCQRTAREVVERLELDGQQYSVAFQSRVGRQTWLRPYTEDVLVAWAKQGVKTVHVVCPGFSIDCLETLEEIGLRARDDFIDAGGQQLQLIPCLNDSERHVNALSQIVRRQISDWPTPETSGQLQRRRERATQLHQAMDDD